MWRYFFIIVILPLLLHVINRLAESEGEGYTIATEKDRLESELDVYVINKDQVYLLIFAY